MRRANMTELRHDFFIVRTQAGFRRALKKFCEERYVKPKDVQSWPTVYPALIHMTVKFAGYEYIQVDCLAVNDIKELIAKA